jgi:hypothetical protein
VEVLKKRAITHKTENATDRIAKDRIILDGRGRFPKKIIILEAEGKREYRLIRTKKGGFLLN